MDSSEYLGLFLDESRDSLRLLDASLLGLERDPYDGEASRPSSAPPTP